MSVFTNPASAAPEQAEAYIRAVLELLGAHDPVTVLGATPDALRATVGDMTEAALATPERDGKWSVGQVLRHLADSEIVWAFRLRMVLSQDRPPLTGYDQDAWAERLDYADVDPAESLAEFTVLRRSNLRVLERASESDLDRVGVHAERGEETAQHMMRLYAGHDLLHLRQIERIKAVVGGAPDRAMDPTEALDSVRQAYMDAFNAGDAAAVAALHTEETISMPAGMPAVTGRDAVRELMESSLSMMPPDARFTFEPADVRIAGGWAIERGVTPSLAGFPAGKYVMLYEREADGCWRIAWSITNSDAPPPAR